MQSLFYSDSLNGSGDFIFFKAAYTRIPHPVPFKHHSNHVLYSPGKEQIYNI